MSTYRPDAWVPVLITQKDGTKTYKIIGSWAGGYLGSDSWKLSSGCTSVQELENGYLIPQYSGSIYEVPKETHCSFQISAVFARLSDAADARDATVKMLTAQELVEAFE